MLTESPENHIMQFPFHPICSISYILCPAPFSPHPFNAPIPSYTLYPLLHKQTIGQGMQLRLGGGFDYWSLYGIHPDEGVGGLVFVSEFRGQIVPNSMFFLRSRFYVVKSDGLQPGIDREGNESAPIILSAGLVWRFQ